MSKKSKPNGHTSKPVRSRQAATLAAIDPTNAADLALLSGLARRKDWNITPEMCGKVLERLMWASDRAEEMGDIDLVVKTTAVYTAICRIAQADRHHEDKVLQDERHHQEQTKAASPATSRRVVVEFVNQIRQIGPEAGAE
jgi:hypothetical protein